MYTEKLSEHMYIYGKKQLQTVLSASDLSISRLSHETESLRVKVYTENYIGVLRIRKLKRNSTIVGRSYVYRSAIVPRPFDDRSRIVKRKRNGNFTGAYWHIVVRHPDYRVMC